ncbi:hypothetical protein C2869_18335 [Saccharobesus litoralis]|uniref:DUF3298 domain-containing protein n=1 Tax=Saccharobesus litoralis TaxID=2172099 RepID=A0A2S0VVK7_9ALTE|nr:hypothetical protein [Saccharobesus litoralis]AWB68249.1 hypothetical protein C2869_18335 [Saccharobesus litoralis]
MKTLLNFFLLLAVCCLASCANQPLVHNYQGDVTIRTLQVYLDPIREPTQGESGKYSKITKVIKGVQEVLDMFDPEQQANLIEQLHTFESTLAKGIKAKSGVPVKVADDSGVSMKYGDNSELTQIEFEYPRLDGAYLDIFVNIYYTERTELSFGGEALNTNMIELKPEISLQIDGYNEKGELFWRQTSRYASHKSFKFGDSYVLGIPTERLQESQIFLVPLAEGVTKNLQILRK